jgi:hypothetical protein
MKLVVRRSALKMWLMALGGIPLLVISLDVLTNRRFTNYLRELLFPPDRTQLFEPRDVIWAWAMLAFSVFIIGWGLKELFVPTKVIEGRREGLAVRLAGPIKAPTVIPWAQISHVEGTRIEDEGRMLPMLLVRLLSREGIPENPWGARWVRERELAILAQDWPVDPAEVAEQIADYAVERVRIAHREAVASLWKEGAGTSGAGTVVGGAAAAGEAARGDAAEHEDAGEAGVEEE